MSQASRLDSTSQGTALMNEFFNQVAYAKNDGTTFSRRTCMITRVTRFSTTTPLPLVGSKGTQFDRSLEALKKAPYSSI